jgi:aryl-alcohol dehydrogenase-like predicted oxidoreductase
MLLARASFGFSSEEDGRSGRHGASAMEYVKLGRTGLDVSRICLGCMSYGAAGSGNHAWSLGEEEARPFIKRALEGGINFFDTANRYSLGSSEEILGRAIRDFAHRDEVVIATKVYGRMRPGPNGGGLSRKAIMSEIDASLRRLGMDYVDLYQIHRWDHETPIEETLEALHDVVKAGKARYIGASSMYAWQFGKALAVAERNGWTPVCQHAEPRQPALPRGRSARCYRCAPPRGSGSSLGARRRAAV